MKPSKGQQLSRVVCVRESELEMAILYLHKTTEESIWRIGQILHVASGERELMSPYLQLYTFLGWNVASGAFPPEEVAKKIKTMQEQLDHLIGQGHTLIYKIRKSNHG